MKSGLMARRQGNPAPVALFVYNRPSHTQRTVESLLSNELSQETAVIIFSDGPKSPQDAPAVQQVRSYIHSIAGFKSVTVNEQRHNRGLASSIIAGVTAVVNAQGRIIVLEDDLVTSPYFLRFMNDALDLYESVDKIVSIHGYVVPLQERLPNSFFLPGADCWGWATWKRGWEIFQPDSGALLEELRRKRLERDFDFNDTFPYLQMLREQAAGKIDSWAIRWRASAFVAGKLTLHPGRSLVKNIGLDSSGTHCGTDGRYDTAVTESPVELEPIPVEKSAEACRLYEEYFSRVSAASPVVRSTVRVRRYLKKVYRSVIGCYSRRNHKGGRR